jgi:hypothetical protein
MSDSKLYFHSHVDYVHSQGLRILGLIRYITHNFSSLDILVVLYNALVKSKLEYASIVWNNFTLTDSNKLEVFKENLPICVIIGYFSLLFHVIMI